MTSRMTLIGIQLCRAGFCEAPDPSITICAVKGKVSRHPVEKTKLLIIYQCYQNFFWRQSKRFSWITYCFLLTQTSTTCLSPCQLPYVAPNCCVIWTAFAYLCQFNVDHKCQTDFFQTEPILLQAIYRYICVNICTKFTERLQFFNWIITSWKESYCEFLFFVRLFSAGCF